MRSLLDVNVLIALLDSNHLHHHRARTWLTQSQSLGWASCPLTQNGCVRIMSQPGYPNSLPVSAVMDLLSRAVSHPNHEFWSADITLLDSAVANRSRIHGHRQVTDLYLLALAVHRAGRFVTFDGGIATNAIRDARDEHLVIL